MDTSLVSHIQNKLFGISYDTVFTTLVTISIFILGYILNRLFEWRKRIRHTKNIRELVIAHLRSLIQPIDAQIIAYTELGNHLHSKVILQYVFHESSVQTDFLTNLPRLDVFQAFTLVSKKTKSIRIDAFNSMFQAIEFIKRQNLITKDQFSELSKMQRDLIASWNAANDAILRFHDQLFGFARRNRITASKDIFLKELNAIVYQCSQRKDRDELETIYKCLVEPVLTLVRKYPSDQRSDVLSPLVLKSSKYYHDLVSLREVHSEFYLEQSARLQQRKQTIETILRTIEGISLATA